MRLGFAIDLWVGLVKWLVFLAICSSCGCCLRRPDHVNQQRKSTKKLRFLFISNDNSVTIQGLAFRVAESLIKRSRTIRVQYLKHQG